MRVETRFPILPGLTAALMALAGQGDADAAPPPDPSTVIEQHCTFCHSRILTQVMLVRHADLYGIETIDAFLIRHHLPDAPARAAILRYLDGAADRGSASP
ncbi:hypothetical protein [Aestuariicoccus sp. MJ-SS9]|uniref:hypothetical protein n=1 Tax=Aestuariicoccus sp. MJ-SS9 TaxID=3079855 RepID=UPI0029129691|nr:hypothetical protein [Aestuariicoccus sp. MJ-SS9]MDU8913394.1 hypothetical protein [Aestuariicoccus sp. MJ-SS9]